MGRRSVINAAAAIVLLGSCMGTMQLLPVSPLDVSSLWEMATSHWERDEHSQTERLLLEIQQLDPAHSSINLALGAVQHKKGNLDAALEFFEQQLRIHGASAELFVNYGLLFVDRKEFARAIESFERAVSLGSTQLPTFAHAFALACHHSGDLHRAEQIYRLVGDEHRGFSYHFDFAVTLQRLGRMLDANEEYNNALLLRNDFADAWLNVAALHHQYGDVAQSIPCYKRAFESATASPQTRAMAVMNMGVAYEHLQDARAALSSFAQVEQLLARDDFPDPRERIASQTLLHVNVGRTRISACMWEDYEDRAGHLVAMVTARDVSHNRSSSLLPFDTLLYPFSRHFRRQIAVLYAQQYEQEPRAVLVSPSKASLTSKLNVAYLSFDFTDHPTAHLMEGLFIHHDRRHMRVTAFGYGKDDNSTYRRRIEHQVDEFVNVANMALDDSVEAIHTRSIHILMDAQGHTRGSRPQITARKPAPVVVNYLVYPGTLGASYVDYIVVDRFVTPPAELAKDFTEKLVLLPHSYQVNNYAHVRQPTITMGSHNEESESFGELAQDAFVFVNFNKIDKIDPFVFALWMAILRRVPSSVLVLLDPARSSSKPSPTSSLVRTNLARQVAAHGIAPDRLRVPKAQHLRRHRRAGLFLDTFVYGAHSTATDALYAGLPVLTLAGDAFASRVGVSLLRNVDTPELIVHGRKEFEDLAVRLAHDPAMLQPLRYKLRRRHLRLFRTQEHTSALEAGQRVMYELYRLGHGAHHVVVHHGTRGSDGDTINSTHN
ncbi:TPA: hypothetical protein N0F65_001511 [Lagenidium giganteum]|uniref:protein O-GlcNAc transferase n=1 Tax=Lagenidium giganteum TaxID=4803 RepID=A0AAV2Z1Z1_9STRA|nr:TPA: hypothetical protein N0F65_001511 [Lagenidium giganteum]